MPPVTAVYHSGTPPTSSGGVNASTAYGTPNSTPIVGRPFRYLLTASGAFTTVYVAVDGLDGYWELILPTNVNELELVITLANTPPSTDFQLRTLLGYQGGVSEPITLRVLARDLSLSDIGVDAPVDRCQRRGPSRDRPLWARRSTGTTQSTPEGGKLNLDSNPGCDIDNINQEIISWPAGTAPSGDYRVFVQYYDDCGIPFSAYNGLLLIKDDPVGYRFGGRFEGAGGTTVADTVFRFTYPGGPVLRHAYPH